MRDIDFLLKKGTSPLNLYRVLRAIWALPGHQPERCFPPPSGWTSRRSPRSFPSSFRGRSLRSPPKGIRARRAAESLSSSLFGRDFGCVVGLEIQTERYTAVAVDLDGTVRYSRSEPIIADGKQFASVFLDVMSEVSLDLESRGLELLGIGVGVSGIVDSAHGVIQQSLPLGIIISAGFLCLGGPAPRQAPVHRQRCKLLLLGRARAQPRRPPARVPLPSRGVPQRARRGHEWRRRLGGPRVSSSGAASTWERAALPASFEASSARTETRSQFSLPDETMQPRRPRRRRLS